MLRCLPDEEALSALASWAERRTVRGAACLRHYLRVWSWTRAAEATGTTQYGARAACVSCLELAAQSASPHAATAESVLAAVRARWTPRLSGARTFVDETEPLVQVSADRDLPPHVMRRVIAMVEDWERSNRRG